MSSKKTLIIIHPHFTIPGGAGKVVLEVGKRIAKKMRVVVIAQKINPGYIKNYPEIIFEDLKGPISSSFKFWLFLPYWRRKAFKVIEKYRKISEISILCNVFPANWMGLPYKKLHPEVKCYWFCQEPSAFIHIKKWRNAIPNPLKRLIANMLAPFFAIYDKRIASFADKIFVNSSFTFQKAKEVYKRDGIVIYPGIDIDKFKPVDYKDKGNYILTVARLSKFKNIDMIIKALAKLKNKQISLKIVGDGEEKNNLVQLAKKLGILSRVEILSGLSDGEVAEIFSRAKMFVLCSKEEPFGMVPVEALASGTLAIADNSGGPKEIIDHGKNGVLVNDMNEDKLAETMDDLLSDEERMKFFSSKARDRVVRVFAWDNSVKKILEEI